MIDLSLIAGAPTDHCYILDEGVALSVKEGEASLKHFTVGDVFGDVGILKKDPSKTSIVAKASKRGVCRCVRMSAEVFKEVRVRCSLLCIYMPAIDRSLE